MILSFDLGTTAIKVSLVSEQIQVLASSQQRVRTITGPGGMSEQDPAEWIVAIEACVRHLHQMYPDLDHSVDAMAVTGHMLGCLPVDRSGSPLHRHLLHSDAQARLQADAIDRIVGDRSMYKITGNRVDSSTLAKMLWFKQERPEIYQKTAWFLQAKDYVTGWLTGQFGTTDYSDASHACLIDINTLEYPADIYLMLGLDLDKLPTLHRGTDLIGKLSEQAAGILGLQAGIPVAAGAGDGACSAVGAGVAAVGDHYCCLGTTAWTACMAEHAILDPQMRNFNIVSGDGHSVGSYGTIQNAGRAIDWAQATYQVPDLATYDRLAAGAEAGSRGLIFLPYLTGERTPIFDPDARGAFIGLTIEHETGHCLRAVIEGISMALKETVVMHNQNGLHLDDLKLIGGGGRSDFWRKVLASVLDLPVSRLDSPSQHATTVGAAILAGTAIGLFANLSDGISRLERLDTVQPDPVLVTQYESLFGIYRQLYPSLKDTFAQLADYRNKNGC